jgi:alkaline phosphatase D
MELLRGVSAANNFVLALVPLNVSGPIHAGTGFQNEIDLTFGPQVVYVKARPRDPAILGGPADGLQFFGHVAIDGATEVMTVTLKDAADTALWSRQIEPQAA